MLASDRMVRFRGGGGGSACATRRNSTRAACSASSSIVSSSHRLMTPSAVSTATTATSSFLDTQAVDGTVSGANSQLGRLGDSNHCSASATDDSIRTTAISPLRALTVFISRGMSDEFFSAASCPPASRSRPNTGEESVTSLTMTTAVSSATTHVRAAHKGSGGGDADNQDDAAPLVANVDTSPASRSNWVHAIINRAKSTESVALASTPPVSHRSATNDMSYATRSRRRSACTRCVMVEPDDTAGGGRGQWGEEQAPKVTTGRARSGLASETAGRTRGSNEGDAGGCRGARLAKPRGWRPRRLRQAEPLAARRGGTMEGAGGTVPARARAEMPPRQDLEGGAREGAAALVANRAVERTVPPPQTAGAGE